MNRKGQAEFLGHVMIKRKLEHLATTGRIEGKRSSRQRFKVIDGPAAWLGKSTTELFRDTCDWEMEGRGCLRLQQEQYVVMMTFVRIYKMLY